jgi:serine/threonine-protein kinase
MAPEQASGDHGRIGRHTDVYGLGGILYELLVGHPPFRSRGLTALLKQVLSQPPPPPRQIDPSIPPALEAVCLKCLEKGIAGRYPTASALAEDLGKFLDAHKPSVGEEPPADRPTDQDSADGQGARALRPDAREAPAPAQSTRSWWPFRRRNK